MNPSNLDSQFSPAPTCRRDFLRHASWGLGAVALAELLGREGLLAAEGEGKSLGGLHHRARADRVIHIFLGGGLSHVDSFDYKPELEKHHGQDMPQEFGTADVFNGKVGRLHQSHYPFKQRGESGLWISDLFPHLAAQADELTVIRSMVAESANHIPGIFQANSGFRQMGFPAMGAWLSYGLGRLSDNLPSFVVLPDSRGIPNAAGGAFNWSSGFLPAEHQGVAFQAGEGPAVHEPTAASSAAPHARRPLHTALPVITTFNVSACPSGRSLISAL